MRIRKNARLITSSSSSSFLVCQLNRSPWDVDAFSLSLQEGCEGDESFGLDEKFSEIMPCSDSFPSGESMELSFEYVQKSPPPPPLEAELEYEGRGNNVGRNEQISSSGRQNSWQHIHHQLKPPPLPPITAIPKKRGRPRKPSATPVNAVTTPENKFYYYSGFGPRWGTRRGGKINYSNAQASPGSSSSNNHNLSEDDNGDGNKEDENEDDDNKKNNVVEMKDVVMENGEINYVMEDDFDYEFYDDDDDDDKDGYFRGRRVRKPVKARSLKSLM